MSRGGDTAPALSARFGALGSGPGAGFVLRTAAWIVVLFGGLRLAWVQSAVLIPFARLQERVAAALLGRAETGVAVDSSCTGSDALALCLGAILAFPAPWRRRLAGAAVGFVVISAFNTVRIASLAAVVRHPELFELLHLKLWPTAIVLVAAGTVFLWMRRVTAPAEAGRSRRASVGPAAWRFAALALALVALYYLVVDRLYASAAVAAAARWAASLAGSLMALLGVEASVTGGVLRTAYGGWVVTPACVLTPLLPVYLAAVLAAPIGRSRKALGVAAAPVLFLALGAARLLVLALPRVVVGSHSVAVHAFYQVLAALVVVVWVAVRSAPGERPEAGRLALRALGLGALAALAAGLLDRWLLQPLAALDALHLGHGAAGSQGVLLLLAPFVVGLYVAVTRAAGTAGGGPRWLAGLALAALLAFATRVGFGELAGHLAIEAPPVLLRAWALAVPLALAWLAAARRRPPAALPPRVAHAGPA